MYQVQKRNGKVIDFDITKISDAIKMAFEAQEKNYQAVLDALFGSVWLTSDNLNAYDAARIAQYRKLARLQHAENIRIDPDLLTITYTLDGDDHFLHHPHKFS